MAQLEKQNALLQGQLKQQQQTVDLDLQARCAAGAKAYFDEQWAGNEPTAILLDHYNHYNKAFSKCFILVEWHFKKATDKTCAWYNIMSFMMSTGAMNTAVF